MKPIIICNFILLILSTFCHGQTELPGGEGSAVRKFTRSFRGEDLTGQNFSKQELSNCDFEDAVLTDTIFENANLQNCSFKGAVIHRTKFSNSDLTGSDFREADMQTPTFNKSILNKVNFEGLDLSTVQLHEIKMRGANFRNVKGVWYIYGSDLYEADLRGANFTAALDMTPANFRKVKYDRFTRWHTGFDPKQRGAVLVESKAQETSPSTNPLSLADLKAKFSALDINQDGVLSGDEALTLVGRDKNGDGDITLEEFAN